MEEKKVIHIKVGDNHKCTGKAQDISSLFRHPTIEELDVKENERVLYDIESGFPYKVSIEHYNAYMESFKLYHQSLGRVKGIIGKAIITGTGGSMNGDKDMRDMFYNPEGFNTKEYGE